MTQAGWRGAQAGVCSQSVVVTIGSSAGSPVMVILRALLNRYVEIVWPVLIYPSLTAIFAFALWLVLFR